MNKTPKMIYKIFFKVTVVLIMVIAAALMLTACGDDVNDDVQSERKTEASSESAAPSEAPSESDNTGSVHAEAPASSAVSSGGSSDSSHSRDIGEARVKAIVLARVPGATAANITELEKEHDDGRIEYEGSIYYNGYEYEFEIDGATGNVLQWEIDD